MKGNKCTSCG